MKNKSKLSKILYVIYLIANGVLTYQVFKLNEVLPKVNYIMVTVQILLAIIIFLGAFKNKSKITRGLSKTLLTVLSVALIVANGYIFKFGLTYDNLVGQETKKDTVSIVVLEDSTFKSIQDIKDEIVVIEDAHEEIVMEAMKSFNKDVNQIIETEDGSDYPSMVEDLYSGKNKVIVVNEAYRSLIHETHPTFSKDTKVIAEYHKETKIKKSNVDVTKDTFSVLITGIDVFGQISNNARSDVNILAVVNPQNKKIVLISIPRDYYVPLACRNDAMDKLTHTGIYGVDCTMDTVGRLFDVDVDFYARVNFTSFVTIVDAIGGVEVQNENYFNVGDTIFYEGYNILNGQEALIYVRDREHQGDGDSGRGRHQVQVLTDMINKVLSPTIITNFNSLLNAVDGSFQTNMTTSDINALVKLQLSDMSAWEIIQEQVSGENARDYSYAEGDVRYVMYPDLESVERVKKVIQEIDFD